MENWVCYSNVFLFLLSAMGAFLLLLAAGRIRLYATFTRAARGYKAESDGVPQRAPAVSIVNPTHNQARSLEENLPRILEQDYPFFEVIVVHEAEEDDTLDVLKCLEARYPRLRHTFIPSTTRFISLKKLAITLGIKSAKYDWVFLTRPDCYPVSPLWLMGFSRKLTDDKDLALGYANYEDEGTFRSKRNIYRRLRRSLFFFRAALGGRAIGGDGCNMAIRKSRFIQQHGYASQLTFTCGEDSLLVDRLAKQDNTVLVCSPDTVVRQRLPDRSLLKTDYMGQVETAHHLSRRGRWLRWLEGSASFCTYGYVLCLLGALGCRAYEWLQVPVSELNPSWQDLLLLILLTFVPACEILFLRKSTKAVGERNFGLLLLLLYDLVTPIYMFYIKWCRWYNRDDFKRR